MKTLKFGVFRFPGTNCDQDTIHALDQFPEVNPVPIWHTEINIYREVLWDSYDALIIPGGFSYGDIIRSGALAKLSPIMKPLKAYAQKQQGLILGICNGFQILCEAGLLPGTLLENDSGKFICGNQKIRVARTNTPFTRNMKPGQILDLPIAHHQGKYWFNGPLHAQTFTYVNNPNGSALDTAAILSEDQRILGMMPHPERNCRAGFGTGDGRLIFQSMIDFLLDRDTP